MDRLEEIEKEIKELSNEKDTILENVRNKKISDYRNSIDINKVKDFYKEYNKLCDKYNMSIGQSPYGYGSYWSVIDSNGKTLGKICDVGIVELENNEIEELLYM